jgi:hypothetical protein
MNGLNEKNIVIVKTFVFVLFFFYSLPAKSNYFFLYENNDVDTLKNKNSLNTYFNHQSNIYTWFMRGNYSYLKNDFLLNINEDFTSNILESNSLYIQDLQNLKINVSDKVFNDVKYVVQFDSKIYSDDRSIGISNAFTHNWMAGLEYAPFQYFSVMGLGGWKYDNQIDIKDNGSSFLLGTKLKDFDLGGYISSINTELSADYLSSRQNNNQYLGIGVQKRFSEVAWNNLSFFYRKFRKDFYIIAIDIPTTNIEKRTEQTIVFNDEMYYILASWASISLDINLSDKRVTKSLKDKEVEKLSYNMFDSNADEFKIDFLLKTQINFSWLISNFKFGINQREEKHTLDYFEGASTNYYISRSKLESYKDNTSNMNFISLSNTLLLSTKNSLLINGLYSLLKYDSPSEDNYDDRDEIYSLISISDQHIFNDRFSMITFLEYCKYRTIFIFGQRSANNLTNQILKVGVSTNSLLLDRLFTKNNFEVLANYTIYDYKNQIYSLKDIAFRQFRYVDSSSIRVVGKLGVTFYMNLQLSERGELFWSNFSEKPADYFIDRTIEIICWFNQSEEIKYGIGYKIYSQSRFVYSLGEKKLDYKQNNHGPVSNITYCIDDVFFVQFYGWYEIIKYQNSISTNKNLFINLSYYF